MAKGRNMAGTKRTLKQASLFTLSVCAVVGAVALNSRVGKTQVAGDGPDTGIVEKNSVKGVHVLFSGKQEEMEKNFVMDGSDKPAAWKIVDGAMETQTGSIATKEKFTNYQLHVEFRTPYMPNAHGQARGNSGVFVRDSIEIQVLDSYGKAKPGKGDCGAVYNRAAPLVNACKPPLQWQTYDIIYRAPRFDESGTLVEKAHVSVIQNGIVVQNNQEVEGPTDRNEPFGDDYKGPSSIHFQFHHNTVRYRNIWVNPLPAVGSATYE